MTRYKNTAPKCAHSLFWQVQDQNITANGTCLAIVQRGENETAEALDDHQAPTKFPAAYTRGSVINRLLFPSKHRAVSQERLREIRE